MVSIKLASEFNELIKQDKVLVVFTAEWSTPCKMEEMILEEVQEELPDLTIVKLDSDRFRSIAKDYSVVNLPVFIIFSNTKVVKQQTGLKRKEELISFINE